MLVRLEGVRVVGIRNVVSIGRPHVKAGLSGPQGGDLLPQSHFVVKKKLLG